MKTLPIRLTPGQDLRTALEAAVPKHTLMYRSKSNPQIMLRPQDVVVLLRLSLQQGAAPTYAALAEELKLTASEIHAGVERALSAQLLRKDPAGKPMVLLEPLRLFVQHGVRYCFPATHGEMTRGVAAQGGSGARCSVLSLVPNCARGGVAQPGAL